MPTSDTDIWILGALHKGFTDKQQEEGGLSEGQWEEIQFIHVTCIAGFLGLTPEDTVQMEISIEGLKRTSNLYIVF